MIRREQFCDGRLVKEIDQIDVSRDPGRPESIDGRHVWLLDDEEVTPAEAEAFRAVWEEERRP
ncbi:hypothetical protein [Streptomyces sp. V3I7]|uniref:hypothetical protein n=1 Tax=Streptomyces sp. V3I7 TaxID=3042278 RepID=UPI0027844B2B|nr:hypothetical protein [Streptomyces sp. V3I7]MDQ0992181.1 hypothetical protein [Streptomyces sp. V3I7]